MVYYHTVIVYYHTAERRSGRGKGGRMMDKEAALGWKMECGHGTHHLRSYFNTSPSELCSPLILSHGEVIPTLLTSHFLPACVQGWL